MGIKYIVQGALCECRFGTSPDKIIVTSQDKVYANDHACISKLLVTNKDIGATFQKNTFGNCAKKNNNPCVAQIIQWSGEEPQCIAGAGNLLTEESKATCPIGGPDCITIVFHGQQAEVTETNVDNVDQEVQSQINPFVDIEKLDKIEEKPEIKLIT